MAFADIKQEREYAKTMCGSATSFDAKTRLKHREDMFLRRLFAMLGKMAKADGRIDEMEVHAATKAFIYFPRAGVRRKFCVRVFNEAKNGRLSLYRLAWEFSNRWATLDDCVHAYELLWDIACANGILKPTQKANLKGICKYLNLPEQCFSLCYQKRKGSFTEWTQDEAKNEWKERWKREEKMRLEEERRRAASWERDYYSYEHRTPISPLQKEYDILGCACDATNETLLKAYRTAAKKYHPDLLRAKGYSESIIQAATAKMSQINDAWAKIRKERKI